MLDSKTRLTNIKRELATVAFGASRPSEQPPIGMLDEQSLEVITDLLGGGVSLVNAQRGLIVVPTQPGGKFHVVAALGIEAQDAWTSADVSETILQTVQREGRGVLTHNAAFGNLRSVLCVPLVKDGEQWGLFYLDTQARHASFKETQLRLLKDYALLTMNLLQTA